MQMLAVDRVAGSVYGDNRAIGNDNGLYRNDAAGRLGAGNASRHQDRFDDNGRRPDNEMNRRNGGSLAKLFVHEGDNYSLFSPR